MVSEVDSLKTEQSVSSSSWRKLLLSDLVKIILIVLPIKLVRKGLGKDCPVIVKVSSIASVFIDMIPPSLVAPAIFDASLAASSYQSV